MPSVMGHGDTADIEFDIRNISNVSYGSNHNQTEIRYNISFPDPMLEIIGSKEGEEIQEIGSSVKSITSLHAAIIHVKVKLNNNAQPFTLPVCEEMKIRD